VSLKDVMPNLISSNVIQPSIPSEDSLLCSLHAPSDPLKVWSRSMSTSKGRTMRSKVERRMQRESGKTLREKRRAQKLKKKLMTEEERLIYNLKRVCYLVLMINNEILTLRICILSTKFWLHQLAFGFPIIVY
jgi:hypothetical protein